MTEVSIINYHLLRFFGQNRREPIWNFQGKIVKKILPNNKKISKELNTSSLEKLLTICHGDAKPDNFMFRKIEIDLEEMECEGLEGILIDWQGGFIGDLILEMRQHRRYNS